MQIKKKIEEYEKTNSLLRDDIESDHLITKDKEHSSQIKTVETLIYQKDKEIERLHRELSDYTVLRSLEAELIEMSKYQLEHNIFVHFNGEDITLLLGLLEGETKPFLVIKKLLSKIKELDMANYTLNSQNNSLDFGERPINDLLNELKEKGELSDLNIKYLLNLAKKRHAHTSKEFFIELLKCIEEINNNCMNYAQRNEELLSMHEN